MSLIKDYLLTQMNNELFDPGIDNLPMPVDGIEPDLEMLTQREQLMEDIDSICDEFFCENFPNSKEQFDELTRVLCDAVVKNFPTK
tara:strand:+ start:816 stop:1073 length:258 start_codon:yes stop_codon:yes gene_type:complete